MTQMHDRDGKAFPANLAQDVANAFVPNPNNFRCLRFLDGNRQNCTPENLEWFAPRGDEHWNSRGSAKHAEARQLLEETGMSGRKIAKELGTSVGYVQHIKHRRVGSHLPPRLSLLPAYAACKGDPILIEKLAHSKGLSAQELIATVNADIEAAPEFKKTVQLIRQQVQGFIQASKKRSI
jgi:hypothetical protein